jgi:hypothetical protein
MNSLPGTVIIGRIAILGSDLYRLARRGAWREWNAHFSGSVSVWSCSGEFTSPRGGVKPPLRQTETLPFFLIPCGVSCAYDNFKRIAVRLQTV